MPLCPNCEYEYVDGISVCPDCGEQLIDATMFKKHLTEPEDWEMIYTCEQTYEAEMLKANLEGAGIESLVMPISDRNFPTPGNFLQVKLFVRKEQLQEAAQIIQDINTKHSENEQPG
jgi:hypothetical protein